MFDFKSEGRKELMVLLEVSQEEFSFMQRRVNLFVLFRTSPDWMRLTYIRAGGRSALLSLLIHTLTLPEKSSQIYPE